MRKLLKRKKMNKGKGIQVKFGKRHNRAKTNKKGKILIETK